MPADPSGRVERERDTDLQMGLAGDRSDIGVDESKGLAVPPSLRRRDRGWSTEKAAARLTTLPAARTFHTLLCGRAPKVGKESLERA